MHISDGVLPTYIALGSVAASFSIIALSAKQTKAEDLPKIAVVTSSFFVASLIHIPLGPTSVHLLIPGMVGVLLGNSAFLSIALGLTLQSLLFQFGGLTALGANTLMMGIPALLCGLFFRLFRGKSLQRNIIIGSISGGLGTVLSAILLALLLYSGGEDFVGVAKLALAAHLPVFVIEGIICGFTISFLHKVKPELLGIHHNWSLKETNES